MGAFVALNRMGNQRGMVDVLFAMGASVVMGWVSYQITGTTTVKRKFQDSISRKRALAQANTNTLELAQVLVDTGTLVVATAGGTGVGPATGLNGSAAAQTAVWSVPNSAKPELMMRFSPTSGEPWTNQISSTGAFVSTVLTFGNVTYNAGDAHAYAEVVARSTYKNHFAALRARMAVPPPGAAAPAKASCTMVTRYNPNFGCGPSALHMYKVYIPGAKKVPFYDPCNVGFCGYDTVEIKSPPALPADASVLQIHLDNEFPPARGFGTTWIPSGLSHLCGSPWGPAVPPPWVMKQTPLVVPPSDVTYIPLKSRYHSSNHLTYQFPSQIVVGGHTYLLPNPTKKQSTADCQFVEGYQSPLVVNMSRTPIRLLPPKAGPLFDMEGNGKKHRHAWLRNGNEAKYLALDRNRNGNIDSVHELFGDATVGPDGKDASNGFTALRKYDLDGNGRIDRKDPIFADLRLWGDLNTDGKSTPNELWTLGRAGIEGISLAYKDTLEMADRYGSYIMQRGTVNMRAGMPLQIVDLWPAREGVAKVARKN